MKKVLPVLLIVVAATVACASSERTVTEGDKHLSYQNLSAADGIIGKAMQIKVTLTAVGVPPGAADLMAVTYIAQAAEDIKANSQQQLANWGGPPKDAKAYSPDESKKQRDVSVQEHESIRWWHGALAAAGAVAAWAAKQFGLGWIPLIGGWLKKNAPAVALGDTSKNAVSAGLQVAIDEGRIKIDEFVARLKEKLKEKLPDAGDALVDAIEIPDLKALVVKEMERRGVLPANTILYDANPDTGEASAT